MEILKEENRVRLDWFEEGSFLFKKGGFKVRSDITKYDKSYPLLLKHLSRTYQKTIRSNKTKELFVKLVDKRSKNGKWSLYDFVYEYTIEKGYEYTREKGRNPLIFEIYTPNKNWSVPWELLLSKLFYKHPERLKSTGILRVFNALKPEYPDKLLDKLNILFIKGDEAKGKYEEVDLTTPINEFVASWEASPSYVKSSICKPEVIDSNTCTLSSNLRKYKPDILIVYSHGRSKPEPGLLFSSFNWVNPSKFKEILDNSGIKPFYVIFLACDIAKNSENLDLKYPKFFVDIIGNDVLAVMGMQAPITLNSSKILLHSLFNSLALGYSLELASIIARYDLNLNHLRTDKTHQMDCYSPTLWTKGGYPVKLNWNYKAINEQFLSYLDLKYNHKNHFNTLDVTKSNNDNLERILRHSHRIWCIAEYHLAEDKFRSLIQVYNIISNSSKIPLLIESKQGLSLAESLQDWSQSILDVALPGELGKIYSNLKLVSENPAKGLDQVLKNNDFVIVLSGIESNILDDPSWLKIIEGAQGAVVVFSRDKEIINSKKWKVESMETLIINKNIRDSINYNNRLVRALSVLNRPIRLELDGNKLETTLAENNLNKEMLDKIGFSSPSLGYMLYSSIQTEVISSMNQNERIEAHKDSLELLKQTDYFYNDAFFEEELITHYLGAKLNEAAVACASDLIVHYHNEERTSKIIQIFIKIGEVSSKLPARSKLIVSWAYMMKGRIKESEFLIKQAHVKNTLDIAWKYGIMAEIIKAKGKYDVAKNALREVNRAISILEENIQEEGVKKRLAVFKHDKARILQFLFYETNAAIDIYRQVISVIDHITEMRIDLAVAKRNLAESLRRQLDEDFTGNIEKQHKEIRLLLEEAIQISRDYSYKVHAESLYQLSKMFEHIGDLGQAKGKLEECLEICQKNGYLMLEYIVENCLLWDEYSQSGTLEIDTYHNTIEGLRGWGHGWAIRTRLNSRLKYCKYLMKINDKGTSKEINDLLWEVKSYKAYQVGKSDKIRMAKVYKMLGKFHNDEISFKQAFEDEIEWSKNWLEKNNWNDIII